MADPAGNKMIQRRAIILHGKPAEAQYYDPVSDSQSNAHWLPWLQQQLCARDILSQTPEMPRPFAPNYDVWKAEFERQFVDKDTILVGHSCGAGFLLRWLSETNIIIDKLVLVAPWLDRDQEYGDLFHFVIDSHLADKTIRGVDVLWSTNDSERMQASLAHIRKALPEIRYHRFIDYGHFCYNDMSTREFPELLSICLVEN